jgi:hypothetical protein
MTWIKKYIDPLNFFPWKILLIDSLEKWGGDKILLLGKGLNTVASTLDQVLPMSWYCTYNTIELYECGVNMIHVPKNFISHYLFILIK